MKTNIASLLIAAAMTAGLSQSVFAKAYNPEALLTLVDRVEQSARQGHTPVVIFDLDDTLTNTRERNLRIFKEFAAQSNIQSVYPDEAAKIAGLQLTGIHFLLADTLKGVGVARQEIVDLATAFWLERFFTNDYCALDKPTPGAAAYLHLLARAGAKIVYLTGRDVPRMGIGTKSNLARNFFPTEDSGAVLMMKPDPKLDDLKFKIDSFAAIAQMGEVMGVFENEPANVNAMAEAFPDASAIFLDTIHSPKPDVPADRVEWVKNFKRH
ncbi:MAG: HAD family hydrolase [Bdellovibrionales bacterium]